jgi:hypothetical protein
MPAISDAVSKIFGIAEFTMHILPGLIETFRSLPPALRVQIRKMFDSSDETSLSRVMASVSRNLGSSRMMVFANIDALTYSMKKKILIYRHTYVHSHSMRHTEMESNGSNGFCRIYSMAYISIMLVLYSLWDDVCRTHYVG